MSGFGCTGEFAVSEYLSDNVEYKTDTDSSLPAIADTTAELAAVYDAMVSVRILDAFRLFARAPHGQVVVIPCEDRRIIVPRDRQIISNCN